jgi:hypothetical protein
LPVSVTINGTDLGVQGYLTSSGSFTSAGSWTTANVGSSYQTWYVDGVQAGPSLLISVLGPSTGGPVSVPGSYTGTPPVLGCSDITGNWIASDSTDGTEELDLTQSGNNVSGTIYWSVLTDCGVLSMSVSSGQLQANGSFNLSGTQPTEYDSCGNLAATSLTYSLTLSGSSCSSGSGTAYSNIRPQGAGITLASKKTPNTLTPTYTPTTAHYLVEYAGYIPVDNVDGPRPCTLLAPFNWIIYKGDKNRGTARVQQSWIVIPGAQHSYNFFANTGPTRNYASPSPLGVPDVNGATLDSTPVPGANIYTGLYTGLDEDNVAGDCSKWNQAGHGSTAQMQQSSFTNPTFGTVTTVPFSGAGTNPLEPPIAPPIYWNMKVIINETNPGSPTAYVIPSHTCYPAHIVKVNGTVVYSYQPAFNDPFYLTSCLEQFSPLVTIQQGTVQVNPQ